MKGVIKTAVLMAIFLLSIVSTAFGSLSTSGYEITDVEVEGVDVFGAGKNIYVERGSSVDVKVEIEGTAGLDNVNNRKVVKDVRLRVEVEGYEYGDIEDRSGFFDVEDGVTYTKHLTLDIPDDIDASEDYTLKVKAVDQEEEALFTVTVNIQESRHDLNIQDVIFKSGSVVEAGSSVFATVWVENVGDKAEEDINVKLSIPALGLSTRDKIDELVTEALDVDDDEDVRSVNLVLNIPEGTESGDYEALIELEYNKGRNVERETHSVTVKGVPKEVSAVETIISVDTTSQKIATGEGAVYKLMFANLADKSRTFSLTVTGTDDWANVRVDPSFVTVPSGESSEMFVFVSAKDSASLGKRVFQVAVNADSKEIKDLVLEAEVTEAAAITGAVATDVRRGLEIAFIVLLIILIILGIIIAITRLRGNSGVEEEPTTAEGQTYYYVPKY